MAEGNRIYVNTATTGTGTVTLGGVVSAQFCTFADAGIADGSQIRSYILEQGTDFEIGVGTYSLGAGTLTRDTVRLSRIGGTAGTTKLNLGGSATVRVIAAKEDLVTQDTSGNVSVGGTLSVTGASTLTGGVSLPAGAISTYYRPDTTQQFGVGYFSNDLYLRWNFNSGSTIMSLSSTGAFGVAGALQASTLISTASGNNSIIASGGIAMNDSPANSNALQGTTSISVGANSTATICPATTTDRDWET